MIYLITRTPSSNAYPIFAQQGYKNPLEAIGRIVCVNCHLANKTLDIEIPGVVLPDTVFEVVVRAFPRSMAWVTSVPKRLVLEHWLEIFSLPLLILKKQGHLASLN
ncbi:hypothetical protein CIPAW_09G163000 [Carya illinoinensis]|uniref:Cytochrome f large domain-containing protein n=1 Tax=Carya illinoinensis TaxID=32201 RepID=A0A8T1PLK1_CARIL|nr:hypothetical protein CIPAW_09G163000 [Carya illinoinensis]